MIVALIVIVTALVQREADLFQWQSVILATISALGILLGVVHHIRRNPACIVQSLTTSHLHVKTWYGSSYEIPWSEIYHVQVQGRHWRFGPVSRFFFNGEIRLHATSRIYKVDLACHAAPRTLFEHIVQALVLTHPELATDGFQEGALGQASEIVSVDRISQSSPGQEYDRINEWRNIRRDLLCFGIVPLVAIIFVCIGALAGLFPSSANPLTRLILFGVLPLLWMRAFLHRLLRALDGWVLSRNIASSI